MRSGAVHQAVDNIRTEGLALDREKEKTLRLRNDKGKALRKLENLALERKNRCGTECITTRAFPCRVWEGGMKALSVLLPGSADCHVMCIVPEMCAEVLRLFSFIAERPSWRTLSRSKSACCRPSATSLTPCRAQQACRGTLPGSMAR